MIRKGVCFSLFGVFVLCLLAYGTVRAHAHGVLEEIRMKSMEECREYAEAGQRGYWPERFNSSRNKNLVVWTSFSAHSKNVVMWCVEEIPGQQIYLRMGG